MAPRKRRLRVVLDTNVWVAFFLHRSRHSASSEIVRLWRDVRILQLIVTEAILAEYVEVLQRLGMTADAVARFEESLRTRETVSCINLGPRVVASRDPDDDVFLSAAQSGQAAFLVTHDRDLLELGAAAVQRLRFEVVRPGEFLRRIANR